MYLYVCMYINASKIKKSRGEKLDPPLTIYAHALNVLHQLSQQHYSWTDKCLPLCRLFPGELQLWMNVITYSIVQNWSTIMCLPLFDLQKWIFCQLPELKSGSWMCQRKFIFQSIFVTCRQEINASWIETIPSFASALALCNIAGCTKCKWHITFHDSVLYLSVLVKDMNKFSRSVCCICHTVIVRSSPLFLILLPFSVNCFFYLLMEAQTHERHVKTRKGQRFWEYVLKYTNIYRP